MRAVSWAAGSDLRNVELDDVPTKEVFKSERFSLQSQ